MCKLILTPRYVHQSLDKFWLVLLNIYLHLRTAASASEITSCRVELASIFCMYTVPVPVVYMYITCWI